MPTAADRVRAVGRLTADGPWIGFAASEDGYRLAALAADGSARDIGAAGTDEVGLLAVAIVHFLASLEPPPPDLEATQADVARLVRSVAASRDAGPGADLARQAVDAIDDGLAADAVALRLAAMLPTPDADPVAILAKRLAAAGAQ
jgi:hypothetical protein